MDILSPFIYIACGILLFTRLVRPQAVSFMKKGHLLLLISIAVLSHTYVLYDTLFTPQGLDINFFNVLSLFTWLVALLLLLAAITMPVETLGIIVFPLTALALMLNTGEATPQLLDYQTATGLTSHILFSILAYSLLSIAAVQASLLYVQDMLLHNKRPGGFIRALPALETMETLLFRIIALGFILLSAALISGGIYLEDMFAQHLVHKTILSIIAWAVFAILLWGRWQFGWRGRIAIRWTISGFFLLMLAYFGSKFVIELVLHR